MPKTRLQLSRLREKFDFLTEELEIAQEEAKAILDEDFQKPDTSTRALQALCELNKTVSELNDVCEQIAEHEDQDNVGVSKNLTEASNIIHNCRILAKGLRTRPQHTSTEKSTSQAKLNQKASSTHQHVSKKTRARFTLKWARVQYKIQQFKVHTATSRHLATEYARLLGKLPRCKAQIITVQDPVVPTVVPNPQATMNVRTVQFFREMCCAGLNSATCFRRASTRK